MGEDSQSMNSRVNFVVTFRLNFPIFFSDQSLEANVEYLWKVLEIDGYSTHPEVFFMDEDDNTELSEYRYLRSVCSVSTSEDFAVNPAEGIASASFDFTYGEIDFCYPEKLSLEEALSKIIWTITPNTPFDDEISSEFKVSIQ